MHIRDRIQGVRRTARGPQKDYKLVMDAEQWKRLRLQAAREDTTVAELINRVVGAYLDVQESRQPPAPDGEER